jgi:hypothetical protein
VAAIYVKPERAMQGSLCDSCQHAHIVTGYRESEAMAFCGVAFRQLIPVPFKVRDCTSYADKGRPTWDQMEDLALPIRETSTAKTTGFIVSR